MNAHVLYSRWHNQRKLPFKSHYKLREDVSLAWLDPTRRWSYRHKKKRQKRKQPESSRVEVPRGSLRRSAVVIYPDASSLSNASSSASTVEANAFRCKKLTDATIRSVHFNQKRLTLSKEFHRQNRAQQNIGNVNFTSSA